jgi:3-phenylpropionate/cinnamic acid dioxygenase small subunit
VSVALDADLLREVEQFLYREARYADEHDYDAWESLWTDDGVYWVPAVHEPDVDPDPTKVMSIIFDNRARIATRIKQLHTGKRHSQTPRSSLRRLVTNVEVIGEEDGEMLVGANFLVVEARERGTTTWGGRCEYRLRRVDDELRMAKKTVWLVDNDRALSTLAFLI